MPLPFTFALGAIPWKPVLQIAPLLQYTPLVVNEAKKLYEAVAKRKSVAEPPSEAEVGDLTEVSEVLRELRSRIEEIEAHDAKQSELVAQMAAQTEALSRGVQVVSRRMNALLWVAAGATVVAVVALVVAVVT